MIQPPSVGPRIGATITPMPKAAIAWPRLCGGKLSSRMAWEIGTIAPPPMPCSTRATMSQGRLVAMPQSTEVSVKSAMQARNRRLRPT